MAATDRVPPLRLCSIATFHAVSFVVAIAIAAHLGGSLPAALGRLDTISGFAFFVLLWTLTTFATRAGLRNLGSAIDEPSVPAIIESTIVAGGWNGVGVFIMFVLMAWGRAVMGGTPRLAILVLSFSVVIGSLLAFTIGAIVGFFYGLVDAALIGSSAFLYRWARNDADPARRSRCATSPG